MNHRAFAFLSLVAVLALVGCAPTTPVLLKFHGDMPNAPYDSYIFMEMYAPDGTSYGFLDTTSYDVHFGTRVDEFPVEIYGWASAVESSDYYEVCEFDHINITADDLHFNEVEIQTEVQYYPDTGACYYLVDLAEPEAAIEEAY